MYVKSVLVHHCTQKLCMVSSFRAFFDYMTQLKFRYCSQDSNELNHNLHNLFLGKETTAVLILLYGDKIESDETTSGKV